MGLPSFTAHSCSPLRYSQSPSRDLPEADIIDDAFMLLFDRLDKFSEHNRKHF